MSSLRSEQFGLERLDLGGSTLCSLPKGSPTGLNFERLWFEDSRTVWEGINFN
jgi:hypothetical protein